MKHFFAELPIRRLQEPHILLSESSFKGNKKLLTLFNREICLHIAGFVMDLIQEDADTYAYLVSKDSDVHNLLR